MDIEWHWYRRSYTWLTYLLLPFSGIFYCLMMLRRWCYRVGLKKTVYFSVPVIVVGNITVGGTGKTPFVIWLADFLKQQGWKPGIVSRGAGGKKQYIPLYVTATASSNQVGDEAIVLAKRTQCPVVICIDRVAAVQTLLDTSDCNVIITDDGLQHYRLGRTMEMAIVDGERQWGNGCLLPAGPLRELPSRLKKVDCVVTHGKKGDFIMQLTGDNAISLSEKNKQALASFADKTVHAVAGIGHPQRFFDYLRSKGLHVIEHVFPDHYQYKKSDFEFMGDGIILMTEKDAVKCVSFADDRFWHLPVEAVVDVRLNNIILEKLK